MKAIRFAQMALAATLLTAGAGAAWAQHHHHGGGVRLGVYVGPTFGWPYYYNPYPRYYYDPYSAVVAVPAQPTTYIEQAQEPQLSSPAEGASGYWYYCHKPDGYYPYVKKCPDGWQKVAPQPPVQQPAQ